MHRWAVTWKHHNCEWHCACANGFPVFAEDLDMFVLRTCAASFSMCFRRGKVLVGWMSGALTTEHLGHMSLKAFVT